MKCNLLVLPLVFSIPKLPLNFNSINHDNFIEFWERNFTEDNGCLVHTGTETISYSLILNGKLSGTFWNLVENCNSVIRIDYILRDRILVWADESNETEQKKGSINFYSNRTVSWRFDLPSWKTDIQSLAVDWISKTVYWSDNNDEVINVCTLDGKICKPIVYENVNNQAPIRFLQIDSLRSRLYFDNAIIEGYESITATIESVSLDGSDRRTLIGPYTDNHLTQETVYKKVINGMVLQGDNIFWSTANLHKISVTGNETALVYGDSNIGLLSSLGKYIYWVDDRPHRTIIHSIPYPHNNGLEPQLVEFKDKDIFFHKVVSYSNQPLDDSSKYEKCKERNCSHLCLRKSAYPYVSCACPAGINFRLINGAPSKSKCNDHPLRLMAISTKADQTVRVVSLDTNYLHSKVVYNEFLASAVAIDPVDFWVYFITDVQSKMCDECLPYIGRVKTDGSNFEIVIRSGIGYGGGLALDYQNQLIYWTDSHLGHIEMASITCKCAAASCTDEVCRKIIVTFDEDNKKDKPRGIVVGFNHIYWCDLGDLPRIEMALQDGSSRTVLVEDNLKWPTSLTLSSDGQILYFVDSKTMAIECVHIESKERTQIQSLPEHLLYWKIHYFENKLYAGTGDGSIMKVLTKDNENKWHALKTGPFKNKVFTVSSIKTVDLSLKHEINEDIKKCPYIYIPKPGASSSYQCACPDDLLSYADFCAAPPVNILIARKVDESYEVSSLETTRPKDQKILFKTDDWEDSNEPAPDYHYRHDLIIFLGVENNVNSLFSVSRKSDKQIKKVITNVGLENASGRLTVDWLGDSIYWINMNANIYRIEQISINGKNRRTVIWSEELSAPYDIKVDPIAGYIFWSDWKQKRTIARATMAGDDITAIMTNHFGGERVSYLSLDYRSQKIYYVDYDTNNIFEISYFHNITKRPKVIKEVMGDQVAFLSPAFYDNTLYWVENFNMLKLKSMNITNNKLILNVTLQNGVTHVVTRAPQIGWSRCLVNNECPGLCVTKPSSINRQTKQPYYGSECVCPSHFSLTEGNEKLICKRPELFMLIGRQNAIYRRMHPEDRSATDQVLSINNVNNPSKLGWDASHHRIYWLNGVNKKIYSAVEDGDGTESFNNEHDIEARDFDIYSTDNLIYWSNAKNNSIQFARLTEDGIGEMRGNVKLDSSIFPDQISIADKSGFIFFTNNCSLDSNNQPGDECKLIYRARLDGSDLCPVLHGTPSVSSLVVYEMAHEIELYWNDANKIRKKVILSDQKCSELNGIGQEIKDSPANSIAVSNQAFFWIEAPDNEEDDMTIYYSSKSTKQNSKELRKFKDLKSLLLVNETIPKHNQYLKNSCKKENCSHICQVWPDKSVTCLCPAGFTLTDYPQNICKRSSNCGANQIPCGNKCMDIVTLCDGVQDCDDGTDEENCSTCPNERQFLCGSGECIEEYFRCDGKQDCADNSDETNCPVKCNNDEWQCVDKLSCVLKSSRCDDIYDCDDNSDEHTCTPPAIKTKRVITWSILAAVLIVLIVLLVFCVLNRHQLEERDNWQRENNSGVTMVQIFNSRTDKSQTITMNVTVPIQGSVGTASNSSSSTSVPISMPPPPPSLSSSFREKKTYRPIRRRTRGEKRAFLDPMSEQRGVASGCSEPPPSYDNLICSRSSIVSPPNSRNSPEPYIQRSPRPRLCPSPVTDKE